VVTNSSLFWGERISQAKNQHEEITNQNQPIHAALLTGSLFDPEDEGDMFLRNVGLLSIGYIVYARRQKSPNYQNNNVNLLTRQAAK
jgi:hypothetical protein